MLEIKGKYTTAKIMIDNVEGQCIDQIYKMVNNMVFTNPISIMPDTHAGKGSVIGFTMELGEKIIPNVVGVDIGCGMLSTNIGENTYNKRQLNEIDRNIRKVIPMGNSIHQRSSIPSRKFEREFPWDKVNEISRTFTIKYNKKFNTKYTPVVFDYDWFLRKCDEIGMRQNAEMGIGTLGGGNHFIEIGVSENTGDLWVTVHSGSRNFGKMICDYHQKIAKDILIDKRENILRKRIEEIKNNFNGKDVEIEIKKAKRDLGIDFDINMNGLEYLEGQEAMDYFYDMIFAQTYAEFNRIEMVNRISDVLGVEIKESIHSIHNYIDFNDLIIRKGAITSYKGEKMIIPFNMRDGLLICEGKSNNEWNFSAPHGAGRIMSRGHASRNLDVNVFKDTMKGIVSSSVGKSTLDESPMAYKNSKMIEESIDPTAIIIDRVKPILNIKDKGDILWRDKKKKVSIDEINHEYKVLTRKDRKEISKERDLERRKSRKNKGIY